MTIRSLCRLSLLAALPFLFAATDMQDQKDEPSGVIGKTHENGRPVIWRFVDEFPSAEERNHMAWLTVVSWKYDGDKNNGMPLPEVNQRVIQLEDALEGQVEAPNVCRHAFSRTGNNLKEFAFYVSSQDEFLARLNGALEGHDRYPIEITFYEDREWTELAQLLSDFSKASKKH